MKDGSMSVDLLRAREHQQEIADSVLDQVRGLVPTGLGVELNLDTPLHELGLDSLARMEAVNRLEAAYSIRFSEDSLHDIETCRDLADCVIEKLGGSASKIPRADVRRQPPVMPRIEPRAHDEHSNVSLFAECLAFQRRLDETAAAGLTNPYFRVKEGATPAITQIDGREVLNFTSFDYLGLSLHPKVVAAAQDAIRRFGTSSTASRLVGGNTTVLDELDQELAQFLGTEAAAVLPSGYGTNASVLAQLFGPDDLILYDDLAHNSIVQGSVASYAKRRAVPHNDYEFIDRLLQDIRGEHRRVVLAIEGAYSMDGDYPDLPRYLEVKRRHGALLYVDEAHSVGVMGATGRGVCEHYGVDPAEGDIWMGTISKALGSFGGYVAGSRILIQYLKYNTPSMVFATASSPASAAAASAAIRVLLDEPQWLRRLRDNVALFLKLADDSGLNTGSSRDTGIVPIILGDSQRCLAVSERLLAEGIDAQPILYPAVPEPASRVRFLVNANHTEEQITRTVSTLVASLR
jgi:8-amino-7-oxononanoate synthase